MSDSPTQSDLRAANRLVTDAIIGVTDIVEAMHLSVLHTSAGWASAICIHRPA